MPILDRFRKKSAIPATPVAKKANEKKFDAPKVEAPSAPTKGNLLADTLLRMPHVSEKAARLSDKGTYVFRVPMRAEKISVKKAVESLYHVKVDAIRMISIQGKPVRRGKRVSYRADQKKALVTLKKGQTIALYEGV